MIFFKNRESIKEIIQFLRNYEIVHEDDRNVHEIYSILIYLVAKYKISEYEFPFVLIKNESPDFRIMDDKGEIILGIEHTIATVQDYKKAFAEFNNNTEGSKFESDYYSSFIKLPKNEIFKGILNSEEPLKGQGYNIYRTIAEWVKIIGKSINNKTSKLNNESFKTFAQNELLIEEDSPIKNSIGLVNEPVNLNIAIEKLIKQKEEIFEENFIIKFDRISIISTHYFIYDVFNNCNIIDVSKERLEKLYT